MCNYCLQNLPAPTQDSSGVARAESLKTHDTKSTGHLPKARTCSQMFELKRGIHLLTHTACSLDNYLPLPLFAGVPIGGDEVHRYRLLRNRMLRPYSRRALSASAAAPALNEKATIIARLLPPE